MDYFQKARKQHKYKCSECCLFYFLFLQSQSLSSKYPIFFYTTLETLQFPIHTWQRGPKHTTETSVDVILYSPSVSGLHGWSCSCSKPQREWQDGPSEHTIDWDDWIEAWLKVQQDHLKMQSVWTGIMRWQDQTLYYHNPICTARSM